MSDETDDAPTAESGDLLLKLLVKMANNGAAFPLTLFVKGVVISGALISRRKYLESFVGALTHEFEEENAKGIREIFGLDEPEPSFDEDGDEPSPDPEYIHLIEARIFAPGQDGLPSNGMAWRGRISEVDAFSYGAFRKG